MSETLSTAALDVIAERRRQMEREGWTPEHDDQHADEALTYAAAVYALHGTTGSEHRMTRTLLRFMWPWDASWFKPTTRRRDLVKAAALLMAEIERLDRAESR